MDFIKFRRIIVNKYECENCSTEKAVDVHHIDKDKKNNNLKNLLLVCKQCHLDIHYPKRLLLKVKIKCPECKSSLGYLRSNSEEWICRSCGIVSQIPKERNNIKKTNKLDAKQMAKNFMGLTKNEFKK